ncbi:hypothetical protein SAY86_006461 [Trapa natans]|uniref:Ubiquitin-like domain-containing protein n=1 Tax=Trapa natans TaxID=22666 RepID=A0AAN7KYV8_TRANT|nr:hypothetical protein SAY86_006461 [Trapa natans]
MMKMTSGYLHGHPKGSSMSTSSSSADEAGEWEMRPGGMLVQKRSASSTAGVTALNLRLRIAHGAIKLEISVSSQATFGEVKKILAAETGLHPAEQRLIFRGRERRNGEYLDTSGVKDRSKLVLVQDPVSIERRFIEMRRNTRIQSALRAISDVSVEVDQLAEQVSAIEKATATGNKVREVQITTLIEILMRQAIKLDGISAEGDAASLKNLQERRVQKCVETLDMLKISNSKVAKPAIVTTKWETFDPPRTAVHQISPSQSWGNNNSLIDL